MLANDGKIVVTNNGKPTALMLEINEENFETVLSDLRRIRAKRALSELQTTSAEQGRNMLTPEEINAEIDAARHKRKAETVRAEGF